MVTLDQFRVFFDKLAQTYSENEEYLTDLDSAIGDADHGVNLKRGFTAAQKQLAETEQNSIGDLLKTVSMQLIKTVGGASGPLYGTFFLKASMAAGNARELDAVQLCKAFEEGVAGLIARGKAEVGDKTMIDTWVPAMEAMKEAAKNAPSSVREMLVQGAAAAETGMKSTVDIIAKKGRASYLGERSRGHQDPGATSSYLMLKTAAETLG
ncbi:MAG: dihydroxyacetone kinase subunit L [Spirochaeta sp. LUC14_002_19_P3]|nr:MAG: dihydroxyacetone kinase subunit L [Spirochaeta sp. LUC14_002_19_P3]